MAAGHAHDLCPLYRMVAPHLPLGSSSIQAIRSRTSTTINAIGCVKFVHFRTIAGEGPPALLRCSLPIGRHRPWTTRTRSGPRPRAFSPRVGYEGASLQAIADRVGVTKQTLLYHYPCKDALRRAVLEHVFAHLRERLPQMLRGGDERPRPLRGAHARAAHDSSRPTRTARACSCASCSITRRACASCWPRTCGRGCCCRAVHPRRARSSGLIHEDVDPEAYVLHVIDAGVANVATSRDRSRCARPATAGPASDSYDATTAERAVPADAGPRCSCAEALTTEERDMSKNPIGQALSALNKLRGQRDRCTSSACTSRRPSCAYRAVARGLPQPRARSARQLKAAQEARARPSGCRRPERKKRPLRPHRQRRAADDPRHGAALRARGDARGGGERRRRVQRARRLRGAVRRARARAVRRARGARRRGDRELGRDAGAGRRRPRATATWAWRSPRSRRSASPTRSRAGARPSSRRRTCRRSRATSRRPPRSRSPSRGRRSIRTSCARAPTKTAAASCSSGEKTLVPLAESAELLLVAADLDGQGPAACSWSSRGTQGVSVKARARHGRCAPRASALPASTTCGCRTRALLGGDAERLRLRRAAVALLARLVRAGGRRGRRRCSTT